MNRTLLLKVKERILARPNMFIMGAYTVTADDRNRNGYWEDDGLMHKAKCGTMACIAGHTCLIGMDKKEYNKFTHNLDIYGDLDFDNKAAELLGINQKTMKELFFVENWPHDLKSRWDAATKARERAIIAGERIDRVIEQHCGAAK